MLSERQLFFRHLAQTSPIPLSLQVVSAEGIYIQDTEGKKYADLISGVSVSNLGHHHKGITEAVKQQADQYLHLMVFGEYIQSPQVSFANLLCSQLPERLNSVYLVNSGSEAVEGALKLAKIYTGRSEIISMKNAYHGSSHGALSVMGDEALKIPFRPLLPDVRFIRFNVLSDLDFITEKTACMITEPVQAEAGVIVPDDGYLLKLRERCSKTGTLLIFDEAQTGFGRTGSLFSFQHSGAIPDILVLAKAMGGGMPLGAFISSADIMSSISEGLPLGHITTFGGHPVSCAAALAHLNILLSENYTVEVQKKSDLFRNLLTHRHILEIRHAGLLMAAEISPQIDLPGFQRKCLDYGMVTDWFLFCSSAFRISPPLIISEDEIKHCCKLLLEALDQYD